MQYMRAYQFIWDRKNWMMNVLMGVVCSMIPVLGQIVFDGYLFEMIGRLHKDPEHKEYADFDFNRFTKYLMRGIWPFLANLILSLVISLPLGLFAGILMAVLMIASKGSPVAFLVGEFFIILISIGAAMVVAIFSWPCMLHAGLSQEFNFSAMKAFAKDFLKRVRKELVLSILFMAGTGFVLFFAGMAICFVGLYFTMIMANMAAHHLMFQLYELYLERGGQPIRSKEERESRDDDMSVAEPI